MTTNNIIVRYHYRTANMMSLLNEQKTSHALLSRWLEYNIDSIEEGITTYEDYRLMCKELGVKEYFTQTTFNKAFGITANN